MNQVLRVNTGVGYNVNVHGFVLVHILPSYLYKISVLYPINVEAIENIKIPVMERQMHVSYVHQITSAYNN